MNNILVTGATGFIGKHLVRKLLERTNLSIRILARRTSSIPEYFDKNCEIVIGDLSDGKNIRKATADMDCVIHLAAVVSSQNKHDQVKKVNINGTKILLDACRDQSSIQKFIYMSSIAVYGNANSGKLDENTELPETNSWPYAESKKRCEGIVGEFGDEKQIDTVILRAGDVLGKDSVWVKSLKEESYLELFFAPRNNSGIINYIWVDDLVSAIIKCVESKLEYKVYNIVSGHKAFNDYFRDVCAKFSISYLEVHELLVAFIYSINQFICRLGGFKTEITANALNYTTTEKEISSKRFTSETDWQPKYQYDTIISKL